jgi:predicted dehydrogenase
MTTVGILGVGGMGKTHARHWSKMPDVTLRAFDIDESRLAEFSKEFEAQPALSLPALLDSCDAIDICLPTHLHLDHALRAIEARKPTICEKPLCLSVSECAEIVDAVERHGTIFMTAQVVRYFPEFKRANKLIKDGAVGTPAAIRTRRGGAAPKGSGGWFADPTLSGGVIVDLMIHDFDWIRWTFGEVTQVYAQSLTFTNVKGIDYSLATLTLESGALAHVEGTWADPGGFRVTFEVAGSEGIIEHDSRSAPVLRTVTSEGAWNENPLSHHDDPYYLELKEFLECVHTGSQPPVTALDGLKAVAIAEAAIHSVKTGKAVKPSGA